MRAKTIMTTPTHFSTSKDKLMEDLKIVVSDVEELLRATANSAGEGAAVARARIQDSLHIAKEHMLDAESLVIEQAQQAAKVTDKYVHENPWTSIGIAAGVGVLIGALLARR